MRKDSPLFKFWEENQPADDMIYKDHTWRQRDYFEELGRCADYIVGRTGEEDGCVVSALGGHMSKSVVLPVVAYRFKTGAVIIVRNNFYNFSVSVESPTTFVPIELVEDFINIHGEISSCYCEGFPEDLVWGSYSDNPNKFTMQLGNKTEFTFFLISFAQLQKKSRPINDSSTLQER